MAVKILSAYSTGRTPEPTGRTRETARLEHTKNTVTPVYIFYFYYYYYFIYIYIYFLLNYTYIYNISKGKCHYLLGRQQVYLVLIWRCNAKGA